MEGWKNSEYFDKKSHIPWGVMQNLLHECHTIGVKALEITGGGEPLAYPHINKLLEELSMLPIDTALVTNGTLLKEFTTELLFTTSLQWVRISIDAGNKDMYTKIRRCHESHWDLVWENLKQLIARRTHHIIGVGYVVTDMNHNGILELCKRAKDAGVNSVRISVAFTSKGADILDDAQQLEVRKQLDEAHKLEDGNYHIADLYQERLNNLRDSAKQQDYDYCGTKDILCVVEGEGNVYTCCTLTGMKQGLIGNIKETSFGLLWKQKACWRKNFNPRKMCKCMCLYEKRNQMMLELRCPPDHLNFI